MSWDDWRDFRNSGAASCMPCRRVLPGNLIAKADGVSPDLRALPDDFCRYCSRALTDEARALEQEVARPKQRELVIAVNARGVSPSRRPVEA